MRNSAMLRDGGEKIWNGSFSGSRTRASFTKATPLLIHGAMAASRQRVAPIESGGARGAEGVGDGAGAAYGWSLLTNSGAEQTAMGLRWSPVAA